MKRYDFIIIGAGASGLSLACHLAASPLRRSSILLVERSLREHERETWAFWERAGRRMPFADLARRSWSRLLVANPGRALILRTHPYTYRAIRSSDFYDWAHKRLSSPPNIDFLEGEVCAVEDLVDGEGGARIDVGGEQYRGRWVFDSRFGLDDFDPGKRYRLVRMQIRGWEIRTAQPSFDAQVATFLDFRTPKPAEVPGQGPSMKGSPQVSAGSRFLYVLPYDAQHALVEHVACIPANAGLMSLEEEEQALKHYVEDTLGITSYSVVAEEQGVNPMTDYPFPRRLGRHVMAIGIAGGMLKPSTGFAFARIQSDSAAIVRSLVKHGHPFDVPRSKWFYRLSERLLLWIMTRQGATVGTLFGALFRVGRTHKILSFLDEKGLPV